MGAARSDLTNARWQHRLPDGRVQCDLCPRACRLSDGQRAYCFVRERQGDAIVLSAYGRASGFCIDPVEMTPLYHFYPGSSVLSFGTAGCNLGCRFCQNWDISKAREVERLSDVASPAAIAEAAVEAGCVSVAFTYNDPVVFAEYALDTAHECRARGLRTVAVTAGYITALARSEFFEAFDAVNIDLKAMTSAFYRQLCAAELAPVLETLIYVAAQTSIWLEVTTLLIPGHNDSVEEIDRLSEWLLRELGPDVPLHFSAFHPDFRMRELARTPPETCARARRQALSHGIRHVYTGNVRERDGQVTRCASCQTALISRDTYDITEYALDGARCRECGATLAGHFAMDGPGGWGRRRQRLLIAPA